MENNLPGGLRGETMRRSRLGGGRKPFGGSAIFGAAPEKKANEPLRKREYQKTAGQSRLTNQITESLEGYLGNIAAAVMQMAANRGCLRS